MKQIVYTGGRGPSVAINGITFPRGTPVTVDDDAFADKILAKTFFTEDGPAETGTILADPAPKGRKHGKE